jgi:hypothetical protein
VGSIFANLEEQTEELLCHIDPRDKDPRSEEQRQAALLRDAKILCPAVSFVAVPNGAKRSQWEAAKAKREGMKSGAPDLHCTWPGRGIAFLEMKDGQKPPTPNQRDHLNLLCRQGHHCGVFRQEHSALVFLRSIGAPFVGWYS